MMKKYFFISLLCCIAFVGCIGNSSNSTSQNSSEQNQQQIQMVDSESESKVDVKMNDNSDVSSQNEAKQFKKHSITEKIEGKVYSYTFVVNNGNLQWSYKGPDVKKTVTRMYKCNPDIPFLTCSIGSKSLEDII